MLGDRMMSECGMAKVLHVASVGAEGKRGQCAGFVQAEVQASVLLLAQSEICEACLKVLLMIGDVRIREGNRFVFGCLKLLGSVLQQQQSCVYCSRHLRLCSNNLSLTVTSCKQRLTYICFMFLRETEKVKSY